jgi:hypothetical protein
MKTRWITSLLAATALAAPPALGDSKDMVIEIYRVAPGKHEEFLRQIALYDQANIEAGLAPRQLFVHQSGASWDFLILQPAHYTDEENEKLGAAYRKLGIPGGAKFFVSFRELVAEHTDTDVEATTAAEYLKKLD